MALFMDIHTLDGGVAADAVAQANQHDLEKQGSQAVNYLRYWVDERVGKVLCLVDAPSADAACDVHRGAHGLGAQEIYAVREGS
jgi:hypothetical protein